jgi:DNA topoisomerase-1
VYERGRALIPSWLAFSVTKLLETKFPKYVDYQFTADMETASTRSLVAMRPASEWLTQLLLRFRRWMRPVRRRGA